jgi:hypothetical protein
MTPSFRAGLIALTLTLSASAISQAQTPPIRERLGVRIGAIVPGGKLQSSHGNGYNLTLNFTERINKPLFLDFRIGAMYMGDLLQTEINDALPTFEYTTEMRILVFNFGLQFVQEIGKTLNAYAGLAGGIYSVSILFDSGVTAGDFSDQHLGGNGTLGTYWRITKTWNLDASFVLHYFRTGDDGLYTLYTGGGIDAILYQIALGIAIDLR